MLYRNLIDKTLQNVDVNKANDTIEFDNLPGFYAIKHEAETTFEVNIYQPVFCLILQGAKENVIGKESFTFNQGQSLIVSHDVSVTARVTKASADAPYLCLALLLDLSILRSLYTQIADQSRPSNAPRVLDIDETDDELINALERYIALASKPGEAAVMAPLILKEIHFRLLMAPHGAMLRQLLHRDSHASRIEKAIGHMRTNFRKPLIIGDLAKSAGMSVSSFHEHFKAITATSPLQYQKDLRLMEARRLLTTGDLSVSSSAFEVGYESPTQFSREYVRKFGNSPREDIGKMLIAV